MSLGSEDTYDQIVRLLTEHQLAFEERRHAPARTSEESAQLRGESMAIGGKSLVIQVDRTFRLFILSAAKDLNNKAIRKHYGTRRTRFATKEELLEMTGLVPGCVPPFGAPILPFPVAIDPSILDKDRIAFNAGLLTHSIIMSRADWRKLLSDAEEFTFSK